MRHPRFGGHLHIALEHQPVERIAGIPAHEIAARHAHQRLDRPDPRPFTDPERQHRPPGGQIIDHRVVDIASMVDDEQHRRLIADVGHGVLIGKGNPEFIKRPQASPCHAVSGAEVKIRIEGRHDIPGDAPGLAPGLFKRYPAFPGYGFNPGLDDGIAGQAISQNPALGKGEGRHVQLQVRINRLDDIAGSGGPETCPKRKHHHANEHQ